MWLICCCCPVIQLRPTLRSPGLQHAKSSPSFTISWSLRKLMSIEMLGDAIQPSHPLSPPSPPDLNLSQHQGLFQWVGSLHQFWPKFWSFSISPSNEYSGLISFRMDWLDLLAVQRTLQSLLQFESTNSSVLSLLYGSTLTSIHDYWKPWLYF